MISLENQFNSLSDISSKDLSVINFKDLAYLFFVAVKTESSQDWQVYYSDFVCELSDQNNKTWPTINFLKNNFSNRIDVFTMNRFINSDNFLTLLLRLIYVENLKTNKFSNQLYLNPLEYTPITETGTIKDLTFDQIIILLKKCFDNYIKIYNNNGHFEHELANVLINQL